MDIEIIVGKTKGKIENYSIGSIISHLYTENVAPNDKSGYRTNDEKIGMLARREKHGKNLYLHVSKLNDVSGFYSYLTTNGFVIRDSKLRQDKNDYEK